MGALRCTAPKSLINGEIHPKKCAVDGLATRQDGENLVASGQLKGGILGVIVKICVSYRHLLAGTVQQGGSSSRVGRRPMLPLPAFRTETRKSGKKTRQRREFRSTKRLFSVDAPAERAMHRDPGL